MKRKSNQLGVLQRPAPAIIHCRKLFLLLTALTVQHAMHLAQ